MKFLTLRPVALVIIALSAPAAMAASAFDPITTAVDFGAVLTGVIAVAALVAAVLVGIRGVRWILAAVRR